MLITSENYFDVAEALHCFLTLNHEGQGSEKYASLCASKFSPGPLWSEARCERENYIYPEITEENWQEIDAALIVFMEGNT